MDSILIAAASGMRSRMESLEMLANNLANANTGGFKTDREFYSLYTSAEATQAGVDGTGGEPDTAPVIEKHYTDYSQGILRQTGNPLNVALEGQGFLTVNGPSGPLYTRSGSLQISSSGTLTTADGYALRTVTGKTIDTTSKNPITISTDGTVQQDGQDLGQLSIVNFNRDQIDKRGLNYFMAADPKTAPKPSDAAVRQGHVEESNVSPAESAVRLVSIMRQFESLQKAMAIGVEMNKHAVEEVAKV